MNEFYVKYSDPNIMPSINKSGVHLQTSNIVFFITGFFSPWKTPKPVSWNCYASFFVSSYYCNPVRQDLNWVASGFPLPLRLEDAQSTSASCPFVVFWSDI